MKLYIWVQFPPFFELYMNFIKSWCAKCNKIGGHGIFYPTPSNLNYFWGFGSISVIYILYVTYGVTVELPSPEVFKEQLSQLPEGETVVTPIANEPTPLQGGGKKCPLGLILVCTAVMVVVVLDIYFNLSGREGN